MTEGLFIVLLVLIAMVPLAPVVVRFAGDRAPYFLSLVPLTLAIFLALNWTDVESGNISSYSFNWVSGLDLTASWRLDGLSLTFALPVP